MRANNKENTVLPPSNLNAIHTKIIKILTFTITFAIKLTLMALKRSTRSSLG